MLEGLRSQRLLALFCAALVLFNFPLLALWDRELTVLRPAAVPGRAVRAVGAADRARWRWSLEGRDD